jgi:hypothetical protein
MILKKQNSCFADRLNSIVALIAMGCALVFSARGTASAASTVQLTAPANGATVSGTISLSCTVPSNVAWINIDVDYGFYATGSYYETTYSTNWNSASVANGSHTIQCNGYASNGSLVGNPVANITVSNGSSTPASTPAPTPTPAASAPAPSGCNTIPGTSTPVGAACFPSSSYPALNNPQDPVNYGADKTGVNDSTAAIRAALANGDAHFGSPGTYLVSLSSGHGIVPPAGRTIECVPGVTLIERGENACNWEDCGILSLQNGGNTVAGCDFQGGNSAPGAVGLGVNQGQFLIIISSNNDTVEGSTFENAWGDTAVQVNTDYTGIIPGNFLIQYNTFSHNAYYGPEVGVANSGTIQNNLQTDGGMGVEDNECSGSFEVRNVVVKNNQISSSVGDCAVLGDYGCVGQAFITGGVTPTGCNYSGVTVEDNYCQGNSSHGALIFNGTGGITPPSYSNDILGPGCSCYAGSNC